MLSANGISSCLNIKSYFLFGSASERIFYSCSLSLAVSLTLEYSSRGGLGLLGGAVPEHVTLRVMTVNQEVVWVLMLQPRSQNDSLVTHKGCTVLPLPQSVWYVHYDNRGVSVFVKGAFLVLTISTKSNKSAKALSRGLDLDLKLSKSK